MRVLALFLLTLIVLPCAAAPARLPQQLKSLSLEQLGNIKITTVSKQPEEVWHTPAAIYVMTQADIRRSGAITLRELLRMVPGAQVSRIQSDQWAMGVRGFASQFSKGLLVLIDGRSVYTPLYVPVEPVPALPFFDRIEDDPSFKSEVLIGDELGYRQLLAHNLYVDIAAFHNQFDNLESFGKIFFTVPTTPYPYLLLNAHWANGIKGTTDGLEIAPDWKPAPWWVLRGSFSHLHLDLHPKQGFSDTGTVASYEDSSPHRMASLQSIFTLPHGAEFDQDYCYVSRLPTQSVPSYLTMDAHLAWTLKKHYTVACNARNLLQPQHREFSGDNGNAAGIRRRLYASLTWRP